MKIIDLVEETSTLLSTFELPEGAALELDRSGKFEVELRLIEGKLVRQVRSRGWVGHIPLDNDVLVRVAPKVPIANLFQMLEVAYQLKSFQLLKGRTDIESLGDVIERLAAVLARRVLDRCRVGLFRTYIDQDEDLLCVRGRIDINGTIGNALRGRPHVRCRYQENTADIIDNQILLWTLNLISHMGLDRADVRAVVREAYRALSGTISIESCEASSCINQFYHRLNDDYRPMHGLCRLFLEHAGPGIRSGDRAFIPFALRMPELFETFVAEWLKTNSPNTIRVSPHYRAKITGNQNLVVNIDLLLRDLTTDRPLAVLDTKYKIADDFSEDDINQVVAYATRIGTNLAFLVYPRAHATLELHYGPVTVRSLGFDLASSVAVAGALFQDALLSAMHSA